MALFCLPRAPRTSRTWVKLPSLPLLPSWRNRYGAGIAFTLSPARLHMIGNLKRHVSFLHPVASVSKQYKLVPAKAGRQTFASHNALAPVRGLVASAGVWLRDEESDISSTQRLKWFCEAGGGSPDEARLEQTPYPFQPH